MKQFPRAISAQMVVLDAVNMVSFRFSFFRVMALVVLVLAPRLARADDDAKGMVVVAAEGATDATWPLARAVYATRFWFWFVVVAAMHIGALRLLPRSAPTSSLDNAMPELTFVLVDEPLSTTTQPLVSETPQTRELPSTFHASAEGVASKRIDDSPQLPSAPIVEGALGIRRVDGAYHGVVVVEPSAIGLSGSSAYRMTTARAPLPVESESARAEATLNRAISDVFYDPEANGALTHGVEDAMRRLDGAPYEGRAILAVRVDDVGRIVAVQVDDCATDRSAWQELATAVLNALAERRLHVSHGAHGMELRVEVTAKVAFASGASSPLDVGLGGVTFDLSDVGSHRQRRVTARVVAHRTY